MNGPVGLREERPVALTVGPAVSGLRTEMELRTGDRKRDVNLSARVPLWPPGASGSNGTIDIPVVVQRKGVGVDGTEGGAF